jgi:hypothetical protein
VGAQRLRARLRHRRDGYSRAGLRYADKLTMVLCGSWLLMFVALRFIVGPHNRKEGETLAHKGVRIATNYVIKQLYQQMFFFLVPLYASSATWSTASWNWWMAPLLRRSNSATCIAASRSTGCARPRSRATATASAAW